MPAGLTMERHRDLQGRLQAPRIRRGLLALLAVVCILALFDVFGQRPSETRAAAATAELEVQVPSGVRGGLLYQGRFTVRALEELRDAQLVLSPSWADGITINTIEPGPIGEASRDGRLVFDLGHVPAGQRHVLYMDFQVNPTTVSRRTLEVELADGDRQLVTIRRSFTIFP